MRDYQIISPSLEGVLNHDSLLYENIKRPIQLLKILDGPASKGLSADFPAKQDKKKKEENRKILEQYFSDLYGIFMNKLSFFVVQSAPDSDQTIKLQAMLQELIKVKKLINESDWR